MTLDAALYIVIKCLFHDLHYWSRETNESPLEAVWVIKITSARAARDAAALVPQRRGEACCTADRPGRAPFSVGSKPDLTRRGGEVIRCQERFLLSPPLTALGHSTPHQPPQDASLPRPLMHTLYQGNFFWIFVFILFLLFFFLEILKPFLLQA